jgi:tetratricopeptide (TPR) repeat protein
VLGNVYELQGDYSSALTYLNRSVDLAISLEHQQAEAYMQRAIGDILLQKGNLTAALDCFKRSEEICRLTGEQAGLVATLCRIGDTYVMMEDWQQAKTFYDEAVEFSVKLNLTRWYGRSLFGLAKVYSNSSNVNERTNATSLATEAALKLEVIGHRDAKMVREWLSGNPV